MLAAIMLFVMSIAFFFKAYKALSGREDELQKTSQGITIGYIVCGVVCLIGAAIFVIIFLS